MNFDIYDYITYKNLNDYLLINNNDIVLYLGGRILDNKTGKFNEKCYPENYCKFLNIQIKKLNPSKIICHSFMYAELYYKSKILDKEMKIDIIFNWLYYYLNKPRWYYGELNYKYINTLIDKNKSTKFLLYYSHLPDAKSYPPPSKNDLINRLELRLNSENIKYFLHSKENSSRKITPNTIIDINKYMIDDYLKTYNASDGFLFIDYFVKILKLKNLNLVGFSCFDNKLDILNNDYTHNMNTTENQYLENDLIFQMINNNIIKTLENVNELKNINMPIYESITNNTSIKYENYPFNYLYLEKVFNDSIYKNLSNELNNLNFDSFDIEHYQNGGKYRNALIIKNLDEENYINLPPNTKKFTKNFFDNKNIIFNYLSEKLSTPRSNNNWYIIFSLVKDYNNYYIEPHTDSNKNIFTMLLYLPTNNDNRQCGLDIYKKNNNTFEITKNIEFLNNTGIIFAPSNNTWHGVKCISNIVDSRNSMQIFFMIKS